MVQKNSTFIGGDPSWANACVGDNGFPNYWDYAKGFSQGATILIDIAVRNRGLDYSVDELIYPVCFNMRHSVELRLKGAISVLAQIESKRSRKFEFDFSGTHDIGNIWNFFVEKAKAVDDRYEPILNRLDKKIIDIAEIDATGQTFRYPLDTQSKKHLVDVALINFFILKESFKKLETVLDELHRLNQYLCDEYSWGTFTKHLSRKNLFELVSFLPHRSTWADESFSIAKDDIKKRFKIGSNELSNAIKRIESHFELAPDIKIDVPLLGVEETDIKEFFGHWFKQHDLPSDKDPIDLQVNDWDSLMMHEAFTNHAEIQAEVWGVVQPNLTPERLAGLYALFYFANDLDFSESYARTYELKRQEVQIAFSASTDSIRSKYFHIFDKANAIYNILRSLYFLRKNELADRLVTTHGLNMKFSWLDEARSQTLFRKSDYCGYPI